MAEEIENEKAMKKYQKLSIEREPSELQLLHLLIVFTQTAREFHVK